MNFSFQRYSGVAIRIVETQEVAATTKITRSLVEQSRLEELLEESKPRSSTNELHYLLSTPFRYPPLRHGSRFGSRFEASLFYGSLSLSTCLAECAYYRFLFYLDMQQPPPKPLTTQHTVFEVSIDSGLTVDLRTDRVNMSQLTHPESYEYTQGIGSRLRQAGTHVLLFTSARDPQGGSNIALYSAEAFAEALPRSQELWQSQVDSQRVVFRSAASIECFDRTSFSAASGVFPRVSG
ncbi:MAG: RES family NAD+ phosphorylase [Cyanobacteria bacterium P01_F01_bin.3]